MDRRHPTFASSGNSGSSDDFLSAETVWKGRKKARNEYEKEHESDFRYVLVFIDSFFK